MSIPLFFNSETGAADREGGLRALLCTAKAYQTLNKHFDRVTFQRGNGGELIVFWDGEIAYRVKDCVIQSQKEERAKLLLLLNSLNKGIMVDNDVLEECENWTIRELGLPSPFMEYAARNDGMLLSVATADDWKLDFFTFQENDIKLPNLWGQDDLTPLTAWIYVRVAKENNYLSILENRFDCQFCNASVSNAMLTSSEWEIVLGSVDTILTK